MIPADCFVSCRVMAGLVETILAGHYTYRPVCPFSTKLANRKGSSLWGSLCLLALMAPLSYRLFAFSAPDSSLFVHQPASSQKTPFTTTTLTPPTLRSATTTSLHPPLDLPAYLPCRPAPSSSSSAHPSCLVRSAISQGLEVETETFRSCV